MGVEDLTFYFKRRFRIHENEGVVIVNIDEGSPADKSGLQVGDLRYYVDVFPEGLEEAAEMLAQK